MDDARLETLRRTITARGWRWREGKEIPYGTQLVVSDGEAEATLDFYPKRGRTVIGGADTPLRRALQHLTEQAAPPQSAPSATPARIPARTTPPPSSTLAPAELGLDESGKGDWFGPLVVAAVYVEPGQAAALRKAGVQDSKLIEAEALPRVAAAIETIIPASAREVLALLPEIYNRRYAALKNINLLLAELYAETAAAAVAHTGTKVIVCDQFAQSTERLDTAFARAGLPKPRQLHHAEAASLAVAAASVLATARFQAELVRLGAAAGLHGPLPRGASAVRILRQAARMIIVREGKDGLGRYAKLNFKPVQEILAERA